MKLKKPTYNKTIRILGILVCATLAIVSMRYKQPYYQYLVLMVMFVMLGEK